MRRIHDYSPFPCPVQGCLKVAGKSYFRESDLLKHSKEVRGLDKQASGKIVQAFVREMKWGINPVCENYAPIED